MKHGKLKQVLPPPASWKVPPTATAGPLPDAMHLMHKDGAVTTASSAAQLLRGARQIHGTLSTASAAALYFVRPQTNNVTHVAEAVTANATAVLTRSGIANKPVLYPGRADVGVFQQEHMLTSLHCKPCFKLATQAQIMGSKKEDPDALVETHLHQACPGNGRACWLSLI